LIAAEIYGFRVQGRADGSALLPTYPTLPDCQLCKGPAIRHEE